MSTVPREQLPLLPFINPGGVYCVTNPLQGHIPPQSGLRVECLQPELFSVCTPGLYLQNGRDRMMARSLQNNILPVPGNPIQPLEMLQPSFPNLFETTPQVLGKGSLHPGHIEQGSMFPSERGILASMSPSPIRQSTSHIEDLTPACGDVRIVKKTQQILVDKVERKSMKQLGPVEKAIFKEALSAQKRRGTRASRSDCKIPSKVHFDPSSAQHSSGMFEQDRCEDDNRRSEFGGNSDNPPLIVASAANTIFTPPQSEKCPITSLIGDVTHQCLGDEQQRNQPVRKVTLPAIRYHPYHVMADKSENDKRKWFEGSSPVASRQSTASSDVHTLSVPKTAAYVIKKNKGTEAGRSSENLMIPCEEEGGSVDTDHTPDEGASGQPSSDKTSSPRNDETSSFDSDFSAARESGELTSPKRRDSPPPRDVNLPDPLPSYITRIEKPPPRVLKESLHCTTCDVYVNSDNQMKQHRNSLRHKNTLQGIPTPPKSGRDDKPKTKSEQYRCNVCKVTLNSDIQLSQHLASQRHKNMMEGKPPKPRWSPYDRNQQAILHSTAPLRLPFKSLPSPALLPTQPSVTNSIADLNVMARAGHYVPLPNTNQNAALKQPLFIQNGGVFPGRDIVYVSGAPIQTLTPGSIPDALQTVPGLVHGQQTIQLQQVLAAPSGGLDWVTAAGLRLAT
ncbi:unnamed protein product [Clavelina lepadiformis]|uniref:C2H2-type domain-containing protein n=1 Tax=Clavelina lepadiformis TaxID=159417 RepID=A0ABP0G5U2_CLALP